MTKSTAVDSTYIKAQRSATVTASASHLIENAFCRLKDLRPLATRHGKLGAKFLSAVALAALLALWL